MLQKIFDLGRGHEQRMVAQTLHKEAGLIEYDAIMISDIHLGSPMCQAQELVEFLNRIRVKYLILGGDIFDDLKFNRLQHWHWEVVSRFRKISDHCHVVWLRGNHDTLSARTMSHLLEAAFPGFRIQKNFTLFTVTGGIR
jgi:UDP-2,3-diacylglucosamine pyrophosphatase LpxH